LEIILAAGLIGASTAMVNWRLAGDEMDYVINVPGWRGTSARGQWSSSGKFLKRDLRKPYWDGYDRAI
jgi:hypothetical protein